MRRALAILALARAYEVYENEEALATHRETPHFLTYFALVQELDDKVERTPLLYDIIN